tara:strand:+ start:368 stop:541 length:174 start_codon:yes stop_codon:yes gene_type:complete
MLGLLGDHHRSSTSTRLRLLIENSHEDEGLRGELWEDLQAGEKVYIRSGYLRLGDLN